MNATSNFYAVTLKNFAAPWTNRDQSVFVPLNDYITRRSWAWFATTCRSTQILSANIVCTGSAERGVPAYSATSNDHYQALEEQGIDLAFKQSELVSTTQTALNPTVRPPSATAGVD